MAKVFKDIPNHEETTFEAEYYRTGREAVETREEAEASWEAIGDGSEGIVTTEMRQAHFNAEGYMTDDKTIWEWYKPKKAKLTDIYTKEILKAFEKKGAPSHKNRNVGESDYATRNIQPWDIWREYALNPWDADIVKRTLRTKEIPGKTETESRIEDYEKIQHICEERIAQLNNVYDDERLHSLTH